MIPLYDLKSGVQGVRLATKADERAILELLLLLHQESGLFTLNLDKVIAGIQYATEGQGGVIFVIEEAGRIVASLGMSVAQDWYSDDCYLLERWNFVHPDYRKGNDYARRLLEQCKWSTDWFQANTKIDMPFQCGITSFDKTHAKIRLYARHFPCLGANFIYGYAPRMRSRMDEAMLQIRQHNKDRRKAHSIDVVPTVETILRLSLREQNDVWKI